MNRFSKAKAILFTLGTVRASIVAIALAAAVSASGQQQPQTENVGASVKAAAYEQIARAEDLFKQIDAHGSDFGGGYYSVGGKNRESNQIIKGELESVLTDGSNESRIRSHTGALKNANDRLETFLKQQEYAQKRLAHPTQPQPQRTIDKLARNEDAGLFAMLLFLVVAFGFFAIPTLVAFKRRHRNRWAILVLNTLFGVTVIGWIAALIWALNKVDDPIKGGVKIGPAPPDPIL